MDWFERGKLTIHLSHGDKSTICLVNNLKKIHRL